MPSEKRARQRAARQARLAQEAAAKKKKRTIQQAVIGAVIVVIIVGALILSNSGGSPTSAHSSKSTTTKGSSRSTTSAVPGTTIPLGTTGAVPVSNACPSSISNVQRTTTFSKAPAMLINTSSTYYANFQTDIGNIKIKLEPNLSPITVNNFVFLACYHYYDGTIFHRVIPGFMDQGGDPNGHPPGTGGPGYTIPDEYPKGSSNTSPYAPGQLAMANTGAGNSGGSQFFIVDSASGATTLDQDIARPNAEVYTIFGQVVSGMNIVQKINADGAQSGTPNITHKLEKVTITSN
ncbi:MAG: peptidylprolyl isomerase [Acidimicrobiales bacterium]|nr:peptidylprolyl isomerase [Acidimicrobiales bacterium]